MSTYYNVDPVLSELVFVKPTAFCRLDVTKVYKYDENGCLVGECRDEDYQRDEPDTRERLYDRFGHFVGEGETLRHPKRKVYFSSATCAKLNLKAVYDNDSASSWESYDSSPKLVPRLTIELAKKQRLKKEHNFYDYNTVATKAEESAIVAAQNELSIARKLSSSAEVEECELKLRVAKQAKLVRRIHELNEEMKDLRKAIRKLVDKPDDDKNNTTCLDLDKILSLEDGERKKKIIDLLVNLETKRCEKASIENPVYEWRYKVRSKAGQRKLDLSKLQVVLDHADDIELTKRDGDFICGLVSTDVDGNLFFTKWFVCTRIMYNALQILEDNSVRHAEIYRNCLLNGTQVGKVYPCAKKHECSLAKRTANIQAIITNSFKRQSQNMPKAIAFSIKEQFKSFLAGYNTLERLSREYDPKIDVVNWKWHLQCFQEFITGMDAMEASGLDIGVKQARADYLLSRLRQDMADIGADPIVPHIRFETFHGETESKDIHFWTAFLLRKKFGYDGASLAEAKFFWQGYEIPLECPKYMLE